jgi:ATP-dependent DNA helicase RecG
VGRGAAASWCYLFGGEVTPDAEERLSALVRTNDGVELAEVDLELRGEGTIMGVRQKGRNDLRLASLRRDRHVVEQARDVAFRLVADGVPDELVAEIEALLPEGDDAAEAGAEFLFKS